MAPPLGARFLACCGCCLGSDWLPSALCRSVPLLSVFLGLELFSCAQIHLEHFWSKVFSERAWALKSEKPRGSSCGLKHVLLWEISNRCKVRVLCMMNPLEPWPSFSRDQHSAILISSIVPSTPHAQRDFFQCLICHINYICVCRYTHCSENLNFTILTDVCICVPHSLSQCGVYLFLQRVPLCRFPSHLPIPQTQALLDWLHLRYVFLAYRFHINEHAGYIICSVPRGRLSFHFLFVSVCPWMSYKASSNKN